MSRPIDQPVLIVDDDRECRGDVLSVLRAARLIDHFGSVRSAISASTEEWEALEGIGQEAAERIDWAVREQRVIYGDSSTTSP
jgi:ERCC4-type nuclease